MDSHDEKWISHGKKRIPCYQMSLYGKNACLVVMHVFLAQGHIVILMGNAFIAKGPAFLATSPRGPATGTLILGILRPSEMGYRVFPWAQAHACVQAQGPRTRGPGPWAREKAVPVPREPVRGGTGSISHGDNVVSHDENFIS